jgi:Protein of unknown function (DUF2637)
VSAVTAGASRDAPVPSAQPSVEGAGQVLIMLTIGAAAGAGSFTHVHDVAAAHGQTGWLAWADAVVLELMSIASGLELRRRKRCHMPVFFPTAVMATAVALSLSAQVIQAEQSAVGWVAAAIPALGFLVMVKVALAHTAVTPPAEPEPEVRPDAVSSARAASSATEDSSRERSGHSALTPTNRRPENDPVVAALLPMARAAAAELESQGRHLSRHALTDTLRAQGCGISNARASALLRTLRSERGAPLIPRARTKVSVPT